MTLKQTNLNSAIICLSILAACLLQIQGDFFQGNQYRGLRLNLADFFVPTIGVLILTSLLTRQSSWPKFIVPKTCLWLCGMTGALLLALYTGWQHQGSISIWGLQNKTIGWFTLMAYFLWGAWISYNSQSDSIYKIFKAFAYFAVFVLISGSVIIFLQDFSLLPNFIAYPYKGLMANRNALGLLTLCLTNFIFFFSTSGKKLLDFRAEKTFWLMLPLIHVEIGSRSCWILLTLQLLSFFIFNRTYFLRKILPYFSVMVLALGILAALCGSEHQPFIFKQNQHVQMEELPEILHNFQGINDRAEDAPVTYLKSDYIRFKVINLALTLWKDHPLIGVGLGTVQANEKERLGVFLDVIDCTPVWLLSETGLLGFILFASFFVLIVLRLKKQTSHSSDIYKSLSCAMLACVILFGVMSLMHEILYTRFLWFFVGLALAVPEVNSVDKRQTESHQVQNPA